MSTEEEAGQGEAALVPAERIAQAFLVIRGERVLLDEDLAELYGVETGALNRAVSRNAERFPSDFMFRLTKDEWARLRCQFGTSKGRGGRRYRPRAFTEQGVAMLSGVLRSRRAAQVNVEIMRAFVRMRRLMASHEELAARLDELAADTEAQFRNVYELLGRLLAPEEGESRRIGFLADKAGGDEG